MKANKVKNLRLRTFLFSRENSKKVCKFLHISVGNTEHLNIGLNSFLALYSKKNWVSKNLKNKCVLSGCNNSVEKKYCASRMELRRLMRFGIIPGYNKSVW